MTICTHQRELLFEDRRFRDVVQKVWLSLASHNHDVSVDAFVAMPNHVHGVLFLHEPTVGAAFEVSAKRGVSTTSNAAPTANVSKVPALARLMQMFKSFSTRRINNIRHTPGSPVWQRGYWEHIVRSEHGLASIREYIAANPLKWAIDRENPALAAGDADEDLWDTLLTDGTLYLSLDS